MIDVTEEELEMARERQRLINAFHRVFASPDGKTVLDHLRSAFGCDAPVFVNQGNGFDTVHAAIRDGQRQVLIYVSGILQEESLGDANVAAPSVIIEKS